MKQTATLVFELKGKDEDNRVAIGSLMMTILMSLEKHPMPNIVHWYLDSFEKAK